MTRKLVKFFATAVFGCMLIGAALAGTLYGLMQRDAPHNIATAQAVVEALSKRWQFADIADKFQPAVLAEMDSDGAQTVMEQFRRFGRLSHTREASISSYHVNLDGEGIGRRATITFLGVFERGEVRVEMTIVTHAGVAMVQHIKLKALGLPPEPSRRSIA